MIGARLASRDDLRGIVDGCRSGGEKDTRFLGLKNVGDAGYPFLA
jgi:hypothetical protein